MTERILLAVDLSYQTYRAAAAHPNLSSRRIFTGGLYGFFMTLAKTIRETRATDLVICRDVRPYKRSETYPEYKMLRKKAADDELLYLFKESLELVMDALEACGIPMWGIEGFESDDLIGHLVMKYRHRFAMIYAASNDSDLYQLLWAHNFAIYRKSIADIMTGKKLAAERFLTPEEFMLATALTGTHNDIEGIRGVGPVTAHSVVRTRESKPAQWRGFRERHGALIDRNLALIKLPHPDFPHEATMPRAERIDIRALYKVLGRYDIDVTGAVERAVEQINPGRR